MAKAEDTHPPCDAFRQEWRAESCLAKIQNTEGKSQRRRRAIAGVAGRCSENPTYTEKEQGPVCSEAAAIGGKEAAKPVKTAEISEEPVRGFHRLG